MLKVRLQQTTPIPLDVQLHCDNEKVLALVGPSGSGKTTVLRAIAGLHQPENGSVACQQVRWFDSTAKLNLPAQQRRCGLVFQNYALFPHMSVADNIAIAMDTPTDRAVQALLTQVHLAGLADRFPAQLSGGQQQRVALARALARQPGVLLLDEPFSAVDKVTRRKLYMELHRLRRELSMPVVLVTHDLDEAAMLADEICVIHQGRTLQQGPVDEVLYRPDSLRVARQVDARNLFSGIMVRRQNRLCLLWQDHLLDVAATAGLQEGERVHWMLSPAKVLLHQQNRRSRGEQENPLRATVTEILPLRGITTVLMQPEHSELTLQMDLPEHVASRNRLQLGDQINVSLLASAIHLMRE